MDTRGWALTVPAGYRVGRWELGEALGAGSWGSVYAARAVDGAAPAQAAVKLLPTRILDARTLRHLADMARRETSALAALAHPRLIAVHEVLVVDDPVDARLDGAIAVVMERADRSLADPAPPAGGPAAGAILVEVCEGLAHIHDQGWIHGDLKPGNVLVMADGSVRLADFGLATELDGTHGYLPPVGSAEYAPPERWSGGLSEQGTTVRPSGDIWALGVTAHRLLSGRSPFPGHTARMRAAAAADYVAGRGALALDGSLAPGWAEFVRHCLDPDPDARPSAHAVLEQARALAAGGPATGDAIGPATSATGAATGDRPGPDPGPRRARYAAAGALAAALVGMLAAGAFWLPGSGGGERHEQWFGADSDVPVRYRSLIVGAGTSCAAAGVSPLTVAAILAAESGFDPDLSDPVADEYGIARWTPQVLASYLPPGGRAGDPRPPFPPEVSIPAVGRYACLLSGLLAGVDGDAGTKIGVAYQTSTDVVARQGLRPPQAGAYADRLVAALSRYRHPPAVSADLPSSCAPGQICLYPAPGFGGSAAVLTPGAAPAGRVAAIANRGSTCVALFTGPRRSGERFDLPANTALADLRGGSLLNSVRSNAPC